MAKAAGLRVTESAAQPPLLRPLSPAASRERLYRERRRRGVVVIRQLVLSPNAINGLINWGWLRQRDRGDREAVTAAFIRFCRFALTRTR